MVLLIWVLLTSWASDPTTPPPTRNKLLPEPSHVSFNLIPSLGKSFDSLLVIKLLSYLQNQPLEILPCYNCAPSQHSYFVPIVYYVALLE